MLTLILPSRRG